MWLINTKTLEMEVKYSDIPPYAILSHTWSAEGEVSHQDYKQDSLRRAKAGFKKILRTCKQSRKDGLGYAWVDTCCIDKTSSSELSEAINSMFRWYQAAKLCYAYLEDVDDDAIHAARLARPDSSKSDSVWHPDIANSRWFTRGWTLQELVAPRVVRFYSHGWVRIGEKLSLLAELESVTGISQNVLSGTSLGRVSVAERMSWAAHRRTTREEDIAYCLMGIFDINMPMLYGEGSKAFIRLQEAVASECDDHSLFAWQASPHEESVSPIRGMLAASPAEFTSSRDIIPFQDLGEIHDPLMLTNRGFRISTRITRGDEKDTGKNTPIQNSEMILNLNCRRKEDKLGYNIGIVVANQGGDQYVRIRPSELRASFNYGKRQTLFVTKHVKADSVVMPVAMLNQYAFFIQPLPEDIRISYIYPHTVPFDYHQRLVPIQGGDNDTESFKAGIVLRCSRYDGTILVILGAVRRDTNRPFAWIDKVKTALQPFMGDEDDDVHRSIYIPWISIQKLDSEANLVSQFQSASRSFTNVQFLERAMSCSSSFTKEGDLVVVTLNMVYMRGWKAFSVSVAWAKDLCVERLS